MAGQLAIDITDEAVSGERFPARLRELGHRLMQVIDVGGRPLHQYVIPPTVEVPAGQFLMGGDRQDADAQRNEFPAHLVNLAGYENVFGNEGRSQHDRR